MQLYRRTLTQSESKGLERRPIVSLAFRNERRSQKATQKFALCGAGMAWYKTAVKIEFVNVAFVFLHKNIGVGSKVEV